METPIEIKLSRGKCEYKSQSEFHKQVSLDICDRKLGHELAQYIYENMTCGFFDGLTEKLRELNKFV